MAEKCVVTAIQEDVAVLASPDATDAEKLAALKFLGHWVGDIHQPLHAGFQDDRGGNHIRTQGSSCDSLHALWDRCLVEERLGMEPIAIVGEIRASITDEQRAAWLASDPADWANESFAIVREPEVGYCVIVGDACQYEASNREFAEGEPEGGRGRRRLSGQAHAGRQRADRDGRRPAGRAHQSSTRGSSRRA